MKANNKSYIYITILVSCFLLSTICNWGRCFSNISPISIGAITSVLYIITWTSCNFLLRNNFSWIKFILAFNSLSFFGLLLALSTQNTFVIHIPFLSQLINFSNIFLSTLFAAYHGLSLLIIWTNHRLLLLLFFQECFCLILLFRYRYYQR